MQRKEAPENPPAISSRSQYVVNEIFYSIQGEGMRAGTANVFVRFTGCNQRCVQATHGFDCDTEFASGRSMTAGQVVQAVLAQSWGDCRAVIFTGGEPGLQLDEELVKAFRDKGGWFLSIETNGSINVDGLGLDWITVSPKFAEHTLKQLKASEVKYVRHAGQGLPKTLVKADHYLLSPAWEAVGPCKESLEWCIKLCKENPTWRLSCQQHKWWKVR